MKAFLAKKKLCQYNNIMFVDITIINWNRSKILINFIYQNLDIRKTRDLTINVFWLASDVVGRQIKKTPKYFKCSTKFINQLGVT
jgi:hypothetical protein